MATMSLIVGVVILAAAKMIGPSHAFYSPAAITNGSSRRPLLPSASSTTTTALCGTKRGRGRLVATDDLKLDKEVVSGSRRKSVGKNDRKRNKGGKGGGGGDEGGATISPLLAEWAKEDSPADGGGGKTATTAAATTTSAKSKISSAATSSVSSTVFVPFDDEDDDSESVGGGLGNNKKKRKKSSSSSSSSSNDRKSQRAVLSSALSARMDELLDKIDETLQTTNCDISSLVSDIGALVDLGSMAGGNDQVLLPALKSILSSRPKPGGGGDDDRRQRQPAYRLAWAGSDDAICHVGTSLHKVPLARLQEIYLLLGYDRWELLEVIRILGPFPNVRNTLKGGIKVKKLDGTAREGVRMEVSYTSMIDGTGKEILAGKEDNVKVVGLDVWLANEKAIVCTLPRGDEDDDDDEGDVLGGNGSRILLFVAEDNLDEQLEKLRAA